MGKLHKYRGEKIEVRYDAEVCVHAAACVKGLPSVFDPEKRPWIEPDQAPDVEELIRVIGTCPSGALSYERVSDETSAESQAASGDRKPAEELASIRLARNGPLLVRGEVTVLDADGNPVEVGTRFALCRCGASTNKPFCDGTHSKVEFAAE